LADFADVEVITKLEQFRDTFKRIVTGKPSGKQVLLSQSEIQQLLGLVQALQPSRLRDSVMAAVSNGTLDTVADRETLHRLEEVTLSLGRYLRSLQFSVATDDRNALNYTFAYWQTEKGEHERIQHRLVVKAYSVGPLIRKMIPDTTLAMSATVSDPDIFEIDTGIKLPFLSLSSDWPHTNTRVFMPTDTPNLAVNQRGRDGVSRKQNPREKSKILRKIAKACKRFGDQGLRSLVIVVSNQERQKFLDLAHEEGVEAISYDASCTPRQAAAMFKAGQGTILVGTSSNYGEGMDLPDGLAPVTFFLRPSYPNPGDPGTQFEEARFGTRRWALWQWRVILQALQVRGRNVRSVNDKGVTIFVSQQFRRFLVHSLPKWLQPAYRGEQTLEQCIDETERLLLKQSEDA
jgi:Rad3-related DNA helicase